jgi:hypothetical protein
MLLQMVSTPPSPVPERQAEAPSPMLTPRAADAVAAILREVQEQEALLQWLRERAKEHGLDPAMAVLAEKTVAHVQSLMARLAQIDPRMAGSGRQVAPVAVRGSPQSDAETMSPHDAPTRGGSGLSLVNLRTGAVISPERSPRPGDGGGGGGTPPSPSGGEGTEGGSHSGQGGSAQKAAEEKKVEQLFSTWEEKALAFESAAMYLYARFDPSL